MHSTLVYPASRSRHSAHRAHRPAYRRLLLLLPLLLLGTSLLLAAGLPENDQQHVTALEYGSQWPLTLSEGQLACHANGAITIKSNDGTLYALNDKAMASGYRAPLAIWKYDEAMPGGVNMPLTPLIQGGSQLCRTTGN